MAEGEERQEDQTANELLTICQSVSIKTDTEQVSYRNQEQMWKASVFEDRNRDQTTTRPFGMRPKTTHRYSDGTLADENRTCRAR